MIYDIYSYKIIKAVGRMSKVSIIELIQHVGKHITEAHLRFYQVFSQDVKFSQGKEDQLLGALQFFRL